MEPKHSGIGIASFVLSLITGLLIFITVAIAGVMASQDPSSMTEESPAAVIVGLAILGLLAIDLVAIILGVVGLFQANRKKTFAVLGTVFSVLNMLGTIGLIIVGIAAG